MAPLTPTLKYIYIYFIFIYPAGFYNDKAQTKPTLLLYAWTLIYRRIFVYIYIYLYIVLFYYYNDNNSFLSFLIIYIYTYMYIYTIVHFPSSIVQCWLLVVVVMMLIPQRQVEYKIYIYILYLFSNTTLPL